MGKNDNHLHIMKTATPPRNIKSVNAVLKALQQLSHATAQDIVDWIAVSDPSQEISLTSVYRALNHLVKEARIKPLNFNDGQVRYELNTHQMHHHHFVCTQCNSIQMLDVCPFEEIVQQLHQRFKVQYHNFEIFGLCESCG